MLDTLLDWLAHLPPLPTCLVLALLSSVENVFPPVPAAVAVALGAFLAQRGEVSAPLLGFVCWAANQLSAAGVYLLARREGQAFFAHRWVRPIVVFEDGGTTAQMALFPDDRPVEIEDDHVVKIRLKDVELRRPRQWGACWLACKLYEQLGLDRFFGERLPPSRKGTRWDLIVKALCCYRLIEPGSEWKLHRYWYEKSAMGDLLGAGFELAEIHKLYHCLDRLMVHKRVLFDHLTQRWKDLFNTKFDVLLYDLTSTYLRAILRSRRATNGNMVTAGTSGLIVCR